MYRWEKVNKIIHNILWNHFGSMHYIDGEHYCTFTRPDNHIIYECRDSEKDNIVKMLRIHGIPVIENDNWCGDRRIGVIVNGFYDEIKENEV